MMEEFFTAWVQSVLKKDGEKTRRYIRDRFNSLEVRIVATQADVDAIKASISQGVQELKDEIQRVASEHPELDLSGLQGIADNLANDNIPAQPTDPEEPFAPEASSAKLA
jgi:hypothetical protein